MAANETLAIEIGRKRVRAVRAVALRPRGRGRGRIAVRAVLNAAIPEDLHTQNAQAIGQWLSEQMNIAGIPRCKAVATLPRDAVALKRLNLPSIDDRELPEMTRLAMQQELSADVAVDFVPLERTESSTAVLAVCAPQAALDHVVAVARAAGITVSRITVSLLGSLAIASEPGDTANAALSLLADVSGSSGVEVAAVTEGQLLASRVEEVPSPQDDLSMAQALLTGVRRVWMSQQLGTDSRSVACVTLLGRRRVCQYAAQGLEQMIGSPVRVIESHPCIDGQSHDVEECWPLLGAILEQVQQGSVINLLRPRRAPDERAALRQRILLAAGLLLVAGMGLFTLANRDLRSLRMEAAQLASLRDEGAADQLRYSRDTYRLVHLQKWQTIGVDWLGHADYLSRIAPGPDQVVLDRWTGTLTTPGVQYDRKARNKWSAPRQVTIVIDGEARDRETADAFRETLVQSSLYSTSSTGADARGGKRMPFGFTYRLRTQGEAPAVAADDASSTSAAEDSALDTRNLAMSEGTHR